MIFSDLNQKVCNSLEAAGGAALRAASGAENRMSGAVCQDAALAHRNVGYT